MTMNKILMMACVTVTAIGLTGCDTLKQAGATRDGGNYVFSASAEAVASEPGDAANLAQARLAAAVNAKAALLEKIKGAKISSSATVADLMFKDQDAASMTRGWLSRAEVTYETKEADRLGDVDQEGIIAATASLTLSRAELRKLSKYVD